MTGASTDYRPAAVGRLVLAAIIATIALVAPANALPAAAASQSAPTTSTTNLANKTTLTLVDQTDWVTSARPFDLKMKVTSPVSPDQLEIVTTVYSAIHSRSQFQQTLTDHITGSSIILDRHPLTDVTNPDGTVSISLPVQDQTQKRYYIRNAGVYPTRVDIRNTDTGDILDHFVTHIIDQAQPPTTRMGVTTVLPVQSPQSLDPKKPFAIDDKGNSVNTVTRALAAHPADPVTLVAEPESLDRLRQDENDPSKAVVKNLAAAQADRSVLQTTWSPIPPAIYDKLQGTELDEQNKAGASTLTKTFSKVVSSTFASTDPIDTTVVTALQKQGVSQVIVREQDLVASQRSTTLTRPFQLAYGPTKSKTAINAAQADQTLAGYFSDPTGPVLGAHRLLSDLAVLWGDQPALQRTVVVMPPRNWVPNSDFLETYLRGIESSPLVTPASIDNLFATPMDGSTKAPLTQRLANPKIETQSFPTSDFAEQRLRLQALANIAAGQNETLDNLGQQLLLAERIDLDNKGHKEWLTGVKSGIDKQLNGIHLPKERSIRLTARQGEMPVTVQNDNGYPVRIRVHLTGNKLDFPDGEDRTIDVDRQYVTERFAIVARTSGAFGVQVQLESPNGDVVLQKSEITVRSTATSSVGVVLSAGAIAFLMVWWIRSLIKSRKQGIPAQ